MLPKKKKSCSNKDINDSDHVTPKHLLKVLFALASKHLLMLIINRGREDTNGLEDVSLLRYSGGDITALGTPVPRSQEFCSEKVRQLRNAHPLSSSILSSITAVNTELLLPKYLESQNSFVLGGDLPREVKISIHDSILIALMIFGDVKRLALLSMRNKVAHSHWGYDLWSQKIVGFTVR